MEAAKARDSRPPWTPARRLRWYRWEILATGAIGGTFLIAFALGQIPGIMNNRGPLGLEGIYAGAGFLYLAGIGRWSVFTRLARTLDTRNG